jgi:hypothetical protein
MRAKHSIWSTFLSVIMIAIAGVAIAGFVGTPGAKADFAADHQLAGVLATGAVYVTGEPGYEEGMWHHVTAAELGTITQTGAGWFDVTWFVGSDDSVLPGTIHMDPVTPVEPLQSDHQLAGLLSTGAVYVTGEPGYEESMWHQVTPTELATITQSGAGWFDIAWYYDELPGTIHIDQ